jgi:hypothetical protein
VGRDGRRGRRLSGLRFLALVLDVTLMGNVGLDVGEERGLRVLVVVIAILELGLVAILPGSINIVLDVRKREERGFDALVGIRFELGTGGHSGHDEVRWKSEEGRKAGPDDFISARILCRPFIYHELRIEDLNRPHLTGCERSIA